MKENEYICDITPTEIELGFISKFVIQLQAIHASVSAFVYRSTYLCCQSIALDNITIAQT